MRREAVWSNLDIVQQRLLNQRLAGPAFEKPAEVVRWLGAVQAQEYPGAKWALSQRTTGVSDAAIDKALADGAILRTHAMRPTWHFVAPEDIRWLQKLTAPRVHAANASMYCRTGLDDAVFARCHTNLCEPGGPVACDLEVGPAIQEHLHGLAAACLGEPCSFQSPPVDGKLAAECTANVVLMGVNVGGRHL